ncbi:hypothetical protein GHT06_022521 [Daphnia sinensis]|uniref:Uncharacterized protein n=1 Tax=Daphnia sinensis TaxID=1820382 RepID=A0AAD5KH96_9CRUS|nr:hypothetical protein GHT06_022521 [Daphnia sinensis]
MKRIVGCQFVGRLSFPLSIFTGRAERDVRPSALIADSNDCERDIESDVTFRHLRPGK